jgi:hypothetical protein
MTREPADYDNEQPTCDHCGEPQWREGYDWNPETGCHLTCEAIIEAQVERLALPGTPGLATQSDLDAVKDRLRAAIIEAR